MPDSQSGVLGANPGGSTMRTFRDDYASAYDTMYRNKDYGKECYIIDELFRAFSSIDVHTILDLGCGTGNHSLRLAEMGYRVTGVDISPDMLNIAREKAKEYGRPISFTEGDVRYLRLGRVFDSVIMMFTVLGYQLTNVDIMNALRTAHAHINKGGIFVGDVWYGPAVLSQKPSDRLLELPTPDGGSVLRFSSSKLDTYNHLCHVNYRLITIKDNKVLKDAQETHVVRYFFPQEMSMYLKSAGFELLRIKGFPNLTENPDENTWNVIFVAKAI
jgi:ubiquinone/menaquinone biosynthesis C-methylase UbiE